ncbi:MAG: cytochrome c3 family protein [Myxococcota bacterium]
MLHLLKTWAPFALLVAWVGLVVADARAVDFFSAEPGPRVKGHANLDCKKCHAEGVGGGIERNKCLGCHDHRDLKARIDAGEGLHARKEYQKNCEKCHADHKGEKAQIIDWRPYGGRDSFPHELTGYELEGAHKRVKCVDCHTKKFDKSGSPKLIGLDQKCLSCHQDVHNFASTRKELMECKACHTYDARSISSQNQILKTFNHAKTAEYALKGAHDDIRCVECHPGGKIFKMSSRPQGCISCHKDVHKNTYTAEGRSCDKCHAEEKANWKDYKFDHNKTEFPLTFQHAKTSCQKCHPKEVVPNPSINCIGCHREDDIHIVNGVDRFEKIECNKCHQPSGFKGSNVSFSHGAETKMELTGRHATVACTECHRVKGKATAEDTFERFKSTQCVDCHSHATEHDGQFNDNPGMCTKCHVPGSDNLRLPSHDKLSSVFAQAGSHAAVSCEKCHDEGLKKLKVGADCISCHEDKHNGTLGGGPDCKKCHTEGFAFQQVNFDHNTQTKYPLTGRHASVSCAKCHSTAPASYAVKETQCVSCHGGQDIHAGKLGNDCAKCHTTQGGALKFNHNTMTKYALTDAHARAQCVGCHFVEKTKNDPTPQVDWTFRSQGTSCKDCHGDPHGILAASTCARCHGTDDWRTRIVDRYHDVPPFSLAGQHDNLECTKCHGGAVDRTGTGTQCWTCHKQDDIHAGALRNCAQCHRVQGWMPSSFTHATTGFPLQGVHRVLDCRQCHGNNVYSGMSTECISCHMQDFLDPVGENYHWNLPDPNCLPCHNQISWKRKVPGGKQGQGLRRGLE